MSRKLTTAELDLFASAFAVTNMGLAEVQQRPGSFVVGHRFESPWMEVTVPASDKEYKQAAYNLRYRAMNQCWDANLEEEGLAERAVTEEYEGWLKTLAEYTLENLGSTWKDLKDVTDVLERSAA